ncbi:MAG: hypothetical protein HY433_03515 [Candidatus Liptonbacteria bacterium]|nr:hypothetical protein [Candidatus Liptonbacteria bacterium]
MSKKFIHNMIFHQARTFLLWKLAQLRRAWFPATMPRHSGRSVGASGGETFSCLQPACRQTWLAGAGEMLSRFTKGKCPREIYPQDNR